MSERFIQSYISEYNDKKISTNILSNNYFNKQRNNSSLEQNEEEIKPYNVSEILDTIFEIHSALKSQNRIEKRNAHSALNMVNKNINKSEDIITHNSIKIDNINNMLKCVICQDMCIEVSETICCGQIFCYSCIIQWVTENYNCPMCRSTILLDDIKKNIFINRLISEIKN